MALNCESTIQETLMTILIAAESCGVALETDIIVTDDGSTDSTYDGAKAFGEAHQQHLRRFLVLRNEQPKGWGSGLLTAAEQSEAHLIVPATGNNNMYVDSWEEVIGSAEVGILLVLYRRDLWSTRPFLKALATGFLRRVILPLSGFKYREVTGGFVAPRVDVLRFVPKGAGHGSPIFLIAGCEAIRRPIKQEWITLRDQRTTHPAKFPNPKYAWKIFFALLCARRHARNQLTFNDNASQMPKLRHQNGVDVG